jgi:hypothetical protein
MKRNQVNILIAIALIAVAALSRILNHEMQWYNLAPVGALGLFCGSVLKDKRYAFLFAIMAQLIGDIYIGLFTTWQGFYGIEQFCVYGALVLVTLLGTKLRQPKAISVFGFSIAASVVFFAVSNLGVWLSIEFGKIDLYHYGHGFTGLVNTYLAAIPFFKNTLVSDMVGSIVLFGAYYLIQLSFPGKLAKAKV